MYYFVPQKYKIPSFVSLFYILFLKKKILRLKKRLQIQD